MRTGAARRATPARAHVHCGVPETARVWTKSASCQSAPFYSFFFFCVICLSLRSRQDPRLESFHDPHKHQGRGDRSYINLKATGSLRTACAPRSIKDFRKVSKVPRCEKLIDRALDRAIFALKANLPQPIWVFELLGDFDGLVPEGDLCVQVVTLVEGRHAINVV